MFAESKIIINVNISKVIPKIVNIKKGVFKNLGNMRFPLENNFDNWIPNIASMCSLISLLTGNVY